ncbi:MAG: ATP-grasp domain-containing protein [Proteobacteria bacterium]|nr:ATP-grasp domain-containing protein [Pseudomonadota bacterium]
MSQDSVSSRPKILSFRRVLVANRGEIAVRIIRTLRELSKESVAVYSDPDQQSMHVRMADYTVNLPGSSLAETYLDIDKIVEAIHISGADAVHPGYGFLSENADFAARIHALKDVTFIGPSTEAMLALGNKVKARALLKKAAISVLPGCTEPLSSIEELYEVSEQIGFPLVLKAAAGGGGKGMRIVRKKQDLKEAFYAAQRESMTFFASSEIFCERYLENPRHIEFQTLADAHGCGVHLFERDCSVQRRHQKLLEEAPSTYLDEASRKAMGEVAVKVLKLVGYQGAATVEFICERVYENINDEDHLKKAKNDKNCHTSQLSRGAKLRYYVMEVNTRIQVEHPVTEMITGIDLIKATISIAENRPLQWQQHTISFQGYALEARINAEDPRCGFIPASGECKHVHLPGGAFVRVDTHIYPGYIIPDLYDSMLAKVIVWGRDRKEAIERLKRALQELVIGDIQTTKIFHQALLQHPRFVDADISTTFLDQHMEDFTHYYHSSQDHASLNQDHHAAIMAWLTQRQCFLERSSTLSHGLTSSHQPSSFWLKSSRARGEVADDADDNGGDGT